MDGIPVTLRHRPAVWLGRSACVVATCVVAVSITAAAGAEPVSTSAAPTAPAVPEEIAARDARWFEAARRAREALAWTDEIVLHDWRLQKRPGADECRILDPQDTVVRSGDAAACRAAFTTIAAGARPAAAWNPVPLRGRARG